MGRGLIGSTAKPWPILAALQVLFHRGQVTEGFSSCGAFRIDQGIAQLIAFFRGRTDVVRNCSRKARYLDLWILNIRYGVAAVEIVDEVLLAPASAPRWNPWRDRGAASHVFCRRIRLHSRERKRSRWCGATTVWSSPARNGPFSAQRERDVVSPGLAKSAWVWSGDGNVSPSPDLAKVVVRGATRNRTGKPKPGESLKSVGRAGHRRIMSIGTAWPRSSCTISPGPPWERCHCVAVSRAFLCRDRPRARQVVFVKPTTWLRPV